MKICIASPDIVGPINNGGVGTACTALAQFLAAEGHEVTLFYTSAHFERGDAAHWRALYARQGVSLMLLDTDSLPPPHRTPGVYDEDNLARSYHVYRQLRDSDFDLIHFVDYIGLGYFTALARSQGLCLPRTRLAVTAHSPTLWSRLSNQRTVDDLSYLLRDRMERRLIALCDLVISPSRYMLEWLRQNDFTLPAEQHVIPNLMPRRLAEPPPPAGPAGEGAPREIVFFGRIEPRKGLLVFCDALDRLRGRLPEDLAITFLGKTGGDYPAERVLAHAERWGRTVRVIDDHDTFQANDYLRQPGRLAVLAALSDNSPYTVLECLTHGIPFIASDVGGVAELIEEADRAAVLFEPTPAGLAARLEEWLGGGADALPRPRLAPEAARAEADLRALHLALQQRPPRPRPPARRAARPLVSVNILHHERPAGLAQALAALRAQSYDHLEIVIVDNGSRSPEALDYLGALERGAAEAPGRLRVLRLAENLYEPAARNAGAYASQGEYLLFMDDDNVPKPQEVEVFLRAALQGGADILTCFNDHFTGDAPPQDEREALKRFVVMGDCGPLGLVANLYGDLNCFVRRDRFLGIGGFVVDGRFNHAEDWRFFAKAWSLGLRLDVVPEALLWYRTTEAGWGQGWRKRDRSGALMRAAAEYLQVAPPEVRPFLQLAQGLFWKALEAENGRAGPAREAQELRRQQSRLQETIAGLESENAQLRERILQLAGFAEHLAAQLPAEDAGLQRGLAQLRRIGAKYEP
ncbi:glycosyltransferase [Pseudoroseomonas cervicalis]|uniref:glycosyltransferase n=1 Tax=Teichococcus cervicalis TaxID=204525 RepID=UPI0022F149F7|nr:glycosyltransferase [Pseudoroseomonas cervicalis]WBV44544.1 glycosyltransferase [Pseudoroseomonas cervicalis]